MTVMTRYCLDAVGIEWRTWRIFPHSSWLAFGLTILL